jgi:hypothetical protein
MQMSPGEPGVGTGRVRNKGGCVRVRLEDRVRVVGGLFSGEEGIVKAIRFFFSPAAVKYEVYFPRHFAGGLVNEADLERITEGQ